MVAAKKLDHAVPEYQNIPTITKILEWYKAKIKDKERIGKSVLRIKEEDSYFKIDYSLDYNK